MQRNLKFSRLLFVPILGAAVLVVGQADAQQLPAAPESVQPQQEKASWTSKVVSLLTFNSPKKPIGPSVPKSHPELDPISIGYKSAPPTVELYLSMAGVSEEAGNVPNARNLYHQALTMQPENLEGMLSLARLEDREGQLDAALHYYLQAAKSHPQNAKALNDLALCYARRGQLAEALPPLEQAIRLEPSKQLYRNNIATIFTELNHLNAALKHLGAVHSPAAAQYNMGVLLHQRDRNNEAIQYLSAALRTDPSLSVAQVLLTQLAPSSGQPAQQSLLQFAQRAPVQSAFPSPVQARLHVPVQNAQTIAAPPVTAPPVTAPIVQHVPALPAAQLAPKTAPAASTVVQSAQAAPPSASPAHVQPVKRAPAFNDHILPTPSTPPGTVAQALPYPTTGSAPYPSLPAPPQATSTGVTPYPTAQLEPRSANAAIWSFPANYSAPAETARRSAVASPRTLPAVH